MALIDEILKLTKQLYPTGRAFNYKKDSNLYNLHDGLGQSEEDAFNDANSVMFSILPDNSNFTSDDAERWEQMLGIITNSGISLSDRKQAIIRKLNHPGEIPARQSWDYLQEQLQTAGFDVYVHENIPEIAITGDEINLDEINSGEYSLADAPYLDRVVNHIDENKDLDFILAFDGFRSVFTVGGLVSGTNADVDGGRKEEFRQLILKIKPVNTVCYLRINYI